MFSQCKSTLLLSSLVSTLMFLSACGGGGVTVAESSESVQAKAIATSTKLTSSPSQTKPTAPQSKLKQTSAKEQARLTQQSKLSINGIGPVRVGMSVAQAETAAGIRLTRPNSSDNKECFYVKPQSGTPDVLFMVTNNRIARVEVQGNSPLTTISGARIGDTESKIKSLYPGQIQVTPKIYYRFNGAHNLTFTPKDPNEGNYRVVFETERNRVTTFRSGKLPEVEWVEGCS